MNSLCVKCLFTPYCCNQGHPMNGYVPVRSLRKPNVMFWQDQDYITNVPYSEKREIVQSYANRCSHPAKNMLPADPYTISDLSWKFYENSFIFDKQQEWPKRIPFRNNRKQLSNQFMAENLPKISRVVQCTMPDPPCHFHEIPLIGFSRNVANIHRFLKNREHNHVSRASNVESSNCFKLSTMSCVTYSENFMRIHSFVFLWCC